MGAASYDLGVDPKDVTNGLLPALLERVVSPDRIESIELRGSGPAGSWPDLFDGAVFDSELLAGQSVTWGGISKQKPPEPLSFVGWIWGQKQEIRLARDPAFDRILPRIATGDAANELGCVDANLHRDRALRDGFLAPRLSFWIPGSGETEGVRVTEGDETDCVAGTGHGRLGRGPDPPDAMPEARRAVESCGLVPDPAGPLQVRLEVQDNEVLDVAVTGRTEEGQRCAEEALWGMVLPDRSDGPVSSRVDYTFGLARHVGP